MNPIWIDYVYWEDYQNKMYETRLDYEVEEKCLQLFKSHDLYDKMKEVTKRWEIASKVNLNKTIFNRQAWIGQSTCNIWFGASIEETTYAWVKLTEKEKRIANQHADRVIEEYHNATLFDY
jgi:hypothetical protein